MRCLIFPNHVSLAVDIYLVRDMPGGHAELARLDERGRISTYEPLDRDAPLPNAPTLRLDRDVLEEIVREAGKLTQSSDATLDALRDTLTLVETWAR